MFFIVILKEITYFNSLKFQEPYKTFENIAKII